MDTEVIVFAAVALIALGYGLISARLERTIISAAMVFTISGMLLAPEVLGLFERDAGSEVTRLLAELTLIVVLFSDASRIDLSILRSDHSIPTRTLAIGLPLTIITGGIVAFLLFPNLTIWEAALLGAILAPTDAALGQPVVSNPRIPVRIRQGLNVESGLNDGIALPVVTVLIALATTMPDHGANTSNLLLFTLMQVTLGPIAGVVIGLVGGKLITRALRVGWVSPPFERLLLLVLALLAFYGAEVVGGNGFIAAFVGGLTLGNTARSLPEPLHQFVEAEGQLLNLLVFMLFGAVFVWPALLTLNGMGVLYALLSLTVIRMIPTAISLVGLRLRPPTILFLGWFGPRGLASILFALLVVEAAGIANGEQLFAIAALTILLSVFAHGISAQPAVARYAAFCAAQSQQGRQLPEAEAVPEMPTRMPTLTRGHRKGRKNHNQAGQH